ncbi:molybdopterin-binding protein [Shewanella sp. NIFS-20-20]|uniref:TOBE domain-containing protein n=1 Tax=Shewanella sp. NIFS-20-20 TaxID=2853806 RepID=UPI001C457386|nr:TOBE domain-containing protein [Shewanella sp. NIFS-20-20]MBV7315934.1 TOBE domain-containing protein [Shewanella sp. NIFS-20-20]
MKISARNSLKGTVISISEGSVNNEVTIEVAPNVVITSIVTKTACDALGLKVGVEAYAVVKASSVMVAVD